MSFRLQRRIRILPGLHLNVSRSGLGLSVGTRGAHIGIDSHGRRYASGGIPGTGVSWREYQHKSRRQPCELCQQGHAHIPAPVVLFVLALVAVVIVAFSSLR